MAPILDAEATRARVQGILHLETQRAALGLDLTVGTVYRVTGAGSVDFGGSELEGADRERVTPELRDEGDDYGWWSLESGSYVVRYNETLSLEDGELAHLLPLERLLLAGGSHPSFVVDGSRDCLETLLQVGDGGCELKENCRITRLLVLGGG